MCSSIKRKGLGAAPPAEKTTSQLDWSFHEVRLRIAQSSFPLSDKAQHFTFSAYKSRKSLDAGTSDWRLHFFRLAPLL